MGRRNLRSTDQYFVSSSLAVDIHEEGRILSCGTNGVEQFTINQTRSNSYWQTLPNGNISKLATKMYLFDIM